MTRRRLVAAAVVIAAAYAVWIALWRPLSVAGPAPTDGYVRVPGVVHIHTTLSDGGGTPTEVIAAARAAGLKFIAITDHNNLDAKLAEGDHDGLLVLVGTEISTTGGHVLGLGLDDPGYRLQGDLHDALDDVHHLGGVAFAAHPISARDDFQWTGWNEPGAWGIELLNGDSQWRAAGWPRLLRTAALYGLNRQYALLGSLTAPDETLARWDALLRERDVAGIAGADAHSRVPIRKETAVRFPSYEALFALARNYVVLDAPLTGRFKEDATALTRALARGRSYIGVDALAPAGGFSFVAESEGRRWTMGDTVPPTAGLVLRAGGAVPPKARLRLLRDGLPVAESQGTLQYDNAGRGIYRVEAHVPGWSVPWVLSNPIYVVDAAAAEKRVQRAAWPEAVAPPPPAEVIDAFDGPTTLFSAEHDPTSAIERPILDPQAGADGRGAARLRFRLALPSAAHPNTFCALVDRTRRDFTGRHGLVLKIKSDREYRIQLQVRDENPASADEGIEYWFGSIRTSPEWREVMVPFSRMRSINLKTDGQLAVDKVRALVFLLDRGSLKPGTEGTIWIDDLAVY